MKLVAHVGQQKLFGEAMGTRASVRAAVSPNSTSMRAIRFVLEQKGLTLGKMMTLCGGPDWPTSVLCGLLRLKCSQMVLGLTPMIFFVLPSVLAGAFQYYGPSWGGSWESLAAVLLQVVVVLSCVLMILALYFIEKAITQHADEIAAYPLDKEVDEYEKMVAERQKAIAAATTLPLLPTGPKLLLFGGMACLLISAYISMLGSFMSNVAWAHFEIIDHPYEVLCFTAGDDSMSAQSQLSPDNTGLRGAVLNGTVVPDCWNPHVKELGWVAYVLLIIYIVCRKCFNRWLAEQVNISEIVVERELTT
uniref:Uncharacterized protein n=1 Tax=Haptolina ericina TaxID=156174 RepID=A0A7S3AMS7_9EUKA|mmetsp:Transcript_2680/g.5808  ORF Transcript_2680/g.5808 Transcript_2680/m.5808 type:complete len:305 (+) Transcript_2680:1-915(+)